MDLCKFKVKITKGHYEVSIVDDLRKLDLSRAVFSSFFLSLPSIILRQMWTGSPFFHLPLSTSITFGEMQSEHFNWIALAS